MKFCTNCGAQIPDGSKFCTECGQRIGQAEPAALVVALWICALDHSARVGTVKPFSVKYLAAPAW